KSPEPVRTKGKKPLVNPTQLVTRHTWVGVGKLFIVADGTDPKTENGPQAQRVPSFLRPSVPIQGQTAAQSLLVPTCTRLVWLGPGPLPSWPIEFSPQAQRVPSRRSASACANEAAMPIQSWPGSACSGVLVNLTPCRPHSQMVPSLRSPTQWVPAPDASTQSVLVPTCSGTAVFEAREPPVRPQRQSEPFGRTNKAPAPAGKTRTAALP